MKKERDLFDIIKEAAETAAGNRPLHELNEDPVTEGNGILFGKNGKPIHDDQNFCPYCGDEIHVNRDFCNENCANAFYEEEEDRHVEEEERRFKNGGHS